MPPRPIRNPPNPWHSTEVRYLGEPPPVRLAVYHDASRSIVSTNDSPDISFAFSVNPYRGCTHACAYCYARPTHEYLDFGAGTDFDRKIAVKLDAPELLRRVFERPSWRGDVVMFSGVTDCYQPLEASYRLTRQCLEVCREYRNPVGIVTKAPLLERDLDLLADLHELAQLSVAVSIPLWNRDHARAIEPGVATPQRRIETVRRLAEAGLDVTVMVAPLIPGLGDEDMPSVLEAAADAGARSAAMVMLRLPGPVRQVFEERLREALPLRADRVLARVRDVRGGELNDPRFGSRMRGEGAYAEATQALFARTAARLGLHTGRRDQAPGPSTFRRPPRRSPQLSLLPDDPPI
jgi:DNA repair photolyase